MIKKLFIIAGSFLLYSQCLYALEAIGGGGGVSKLIAGTNITLSPTSGKGDVTVTASGGGISDSTNTCITPQTFTASTTFNNQTTFNASTTFKATVHSTSGFTSGGSTITSVNTGRITFPDGSSLITAPSSAQSSTAAITVFDTALSTKGTVLAVGVSSSDIGISLVEGNTAYISLSTDVAKKSQTNTWGARQDFTTATIAGAPISTTTYFFNGAGFGGSLSQSSGTTIILRDTTGGTGLPLQEGATNYLSSVSSGTTYDLSKSTLSISSLSVTNLSVGGANGSSVAFTNDVVYITVNSGGVFELSKTSGAINGQRILTARTTSTIRLQYQDFVNFSTATAETAFSSMSAFGKAYFDPLVSSGTMVYKWLDLSDIEVVQSQDIGISTFVIVTTGAISSGDSSNYIFSLAIATNGSTNPQSLTFGNPITVTVAGQTLTGAGIRSAGKTVFSGWSSVIGSGKVVACVRIARTSGISTTTEWILSAPLTYVEQK